ncbi:MAG TPA: hypothetical protein PLX03_06420, partial [Candidatus Hydrogenedentes bacterium]|nr:hypothetical protein [Candidatus Hydrogenedentota bacterium]
MNHPAEGSRRDALTARRALALLALAACVTVLVPLALQGSAGQAYRRLSEELAARFGVSLTVRDVRFVFPREVVLWGVRLTRDGTAREPALQIDADELRIQPDLTSLLSGYTSLGRIVIRDARISLRLPEAEQVQAKALSPAPSASGAPAGTPKDRLAAVFSRLPHLPDLPFRVSLYRCSVEIDGLPIPGNAARVNGIDADLYQPPESADRFLRVSGDVSIGDETVPALVRARISGWQDAAVTLSLESVNVNRVAGLFPAKIPGWDPAGLVSLRAELEASRSNPLKAHIRADFSGILPPAPLSTLSDLISGTLDLDAAVEPDFGKLALHTALRSSILELFGDGTLDLNTNEPQIKATIRSEALPIEPLVKTGLAFAPPEAAGVSLTPAGPGRAAVFLSGPARNPGISVEAYLPGVSARYAYPDPKIPPVRVEFGQVLLRWTRGQKFPEGMISILDGGLEKPFQTINLDRVSATILLEKGQLRLKPFSARLNGEPIFGDLSADLETLKADVSAVLSVKDIEKTPLGHPSSDLWLSGEAILRATGQISPKRIDLKASAEATRAGIGLEWWLRKPIGVGASIHEARLILEPGKLLKVEGEASVDATPIKALLEYDWDSSQKKWAVNHIRVDLPHMDVNSAGKCFNLPYTITGTFAKDGFYERNRRGDRIGGNIMEIGGYIDQARLLP